MAIWFRKNAGDWNGDPSADPSTGTGGYDLTGIGVACVPMGFADNNDSNFNFGGGTFAQSVPSGFTAGWPNAANTGFTSLDPTSVQGDASVGGGGNLNISASPAQGSAYGLAADQQVAGKFYFECELAGGDIFSATAGVGVCIPGALLASITKGEYDGTNSNGGGVCLTGDVLLSLPYSIWVSGTQVNASVFTLTTGDVICVAVTLAPFALTGVEGTGQAGTITTDIVDVTSMTMTLLEGKEYLQTPGDNNLNLRWSDDGGNTFGNPLIQSMGAEGQYNASIVFQNLGLSRDRIFEVSWASDGKSALQGIFLQVDVLDGQSAPVLGNMSYRR